MIDVDAVSDQLAPMRDAFFIDDQIERIGSVPGVEEKCSSRYFAAGGVRSRSNETGRADRRREFYQIEQTLPSRNGELRMTSPLRPSRGFRYLAASAREKMPPTSSATFTSRKYLDEHFLLDAWDRSDPLYLIIDEKRVAHWRQLITDRVPHLSSGYDLRIAGDPEQPVVKRFVNVQGQHYRTIWPKRGEERVIQLIVMRRLPHQFVIEEVRTVAKWPPRFARCMFAALV